jgi:hypothetical protein
VVLAERALHRGLVLPSGDGEAAQAGEAGDDRDEAGLGDEVLDVLPRVGADALALGRVRGRDPGQRDHAGRVAVARCGAQRVAVLGGLGGDRLGQRQLDELGGAQRSDPRRLDPGRLVLAP